MVGVFKIFPQGLQHMSILLIKGAHQTENYIIKYVTIADTDMPAHPPSQIRMFAVCR